jgi:pimeloyl-ACP methyl ester carboxylesterase
VTDRRRRVAVAALALALASVYAYLSRPARGGAWLRDLALREEYRSVGGESLRFVRLGSGPTLVLIHGLGSSIYTWSAVLRPLAETHEVVALDLPGFGGSGRPPDLSFDRLRRAVAGLVESLGLEQVTLVGNSLGGAVAVSIAASRADLVSRLVLIDSAGFGGPEAIPRLVRWSVSGPGAFLERFGAFRRLYVWAALTQVFDDPDRVTSERIDEYLAPLQRPGTVRSLRSLLDQSPEDWRHLQEAIGRVSAPTLIIWGAEDAWLPPADAARFERAIPGSRAIVLEGCGHLPQEECPERVLELLRSFSAAR